MALSLDRVFTPILDGSIGLRVLPDYAQVAATRAYYSGMRMGEVSSLKWSQVNWSAGKLSLRAQDTKTETPRVVYLTGDLLRVLTA
ncbi:MAG: hypothetical protein FJ244_00245 [Nitrospira sp.]|nr:hypothetical protein [Nitrospira sp.]